MNNLLPALERGITFTLLWIIVPLLMFQLIVISKKIVLCVREPERKLSAQAGWWAGWVLFALFLMYRPTTFHLSFHHSSSLALNIPSVCIGFIISGVLLWFLQTWLASKAIGFITMLLSLGGSLSLYTYLFIRAYNDILLSATLGVALGGLMYMVIFPKNFQAILLGRSPGSSLN